LARYASDCQVMVDNILVPDWGVIYETVLTFFPTTVIGDPPAITMTGINVGYGA